LARGVAVVDELAATAPLEGLLAGSEKFIKLHFMGERRKKSHGGKINKIK
jgi:hypothetical protein